MAVSAALCRAVSSVACSAARVAVRGRLTARLDSTVVCPSRPLLRPASGLCLGSLRALPTFRLMATATDANLLRVIDAEIECAVESGDHEQADDILKKFPFEIKDEPGTASIVPNRNFHGEKIEVIVSMPDMIDQMDEKDGDHHHEADEQQSQSSLPLVVKVSKDNAFADEVESDNLAIKEAGDFENDLIYEGPEFSQYELKNENEEGKVLGEEASLFNKLSDDVPRDANPQEASEKGLSAKIGIMVKSFEKPKYFGAFGVPTDKNRVKLPTTRTLITVLRSPHIDKKSREQFEMKIRREYIIIKCQPHEMHKKYFWFKRTRILGAQIELVFSYKTRLDMGRLKAST